VKNYAALPPSAKIEKNWKLFPTNFKADDPTTSHETINERYWAEVSIFTDKLLTLDDMPYNRQSKI